MSNLRIDADSRFLKFLLLKAGVVYVNFCLVYNYKLFFFTFSISKPEGGPYGFNLGAILLLSLHFQVIALYKPYNRRSEAILLIFIVKYAISSRKLVLLCLVVCIFAQSKL